MWFKQTEQNNKWNYLLVLLYCVGFTLSVVLKSKQQFLGMLSLKKKEGEGEKKIIRYFYGLVKMINLTQQD